MVLSMTNVVPDMLESILVRLDVKDLIRCKNVSKLWRLFISSNRFVYAHSRFRYHTDRNNSEFRHRRIVMVQLSRHHSREYFYGLPHNNMYRHDTKCNIVGSSNGLVCIVHSSRAHMSVANPSTRQFRILPKPLPGYVPIVHGGYNLIGPIGFGYDSFSDDYKVVLGSRGGPSCTRFTVFSLKTNAWKHAGQFGCSQLVLQFVGAFCNGAIHWFMKADNSKYVIIAFDLSTEEFKEIPQPPDLDCTLSSRLGIIDGCLCICHPTIYFGDRPIWVMKTYNVKSSWTLLPPYDDVPHKVNDAIHTLKCPEDDYVPHTSFFTDDKIELRYKGTDLCAPIFVHSLVSPHVYRRLKRKREPTNNHKLHVLPSCPVSDSCGLDVEKDLILIIYVE
ncbi:putative F-box domain-containing protein [Tanacetum coccineum]